MEYLRNTGYFTLAYVHMIKFTIGPVIHCVYITMSFTIGSDRLRADITIICFTIGAVSHGVYTPMISVRYVLFRH